MYGVHPDLEAELAVRAAQQGPEDAEEKRERPGRVVLVVHEGGAQARAPLTPLAGGRGSRLVFLGRRRRRRHRAEVARGAARDFHLGLFVRHTCVCVVRVQREAEVEGTLPKDEQNNPAERTNVSRVFEALSWN